MIAIMIADLDILPKKKLLRCVYHFDPFNQRLGLQGSSQRDHCGEQTKGSNDLDNFSPKKSRAFSRMKGPAVYPPFPKAVKGL